MANRYRLFDMRTPWLWVICRDYQCGHNRAVALAPWAIRWGVADPTTLIFECFRCSMCGKRGAMTQGSSPDHDLKTHAQFPANSLSIGGKRRVGESCTAREVRCAAIYGFKWRNRLQRYWPG